MQNLIISDTRAGLALTNGRRRLATALLVGTMSIVVVTVIAGSAQLPGSAHAWATLACAGLLSGFLAGLLGIGGALITVPALYLALPQLGVAAQTLPQAVVACALMAMIPTTMAAARSHQRRGTIDAGWLRRLAPSMACGAVIGATLGLQLRGPVLALAFAAQTLWYGTHLICGGSRDKPGAVATWMARQPPHLAGNAFAAFCACVGMGGGSMLTPYLCCKGLPLKSAVATASALNLCIAFGGSLTFVLGALASTTAPVGQLWPAAMVIAAFAVLSAPWGVRAAVRLPVRRFSLAVGTISVIGALALAGPIAMSSRTAPDLVQTAPIKLAATQSAPVRPVAAAAGALQAHTGRSSGVPLDASPSAH